MISAPAELTLAMRLIVAAIVLATLIAIVNDLRK